MSASWTFSRDGQLTTGGHVVAEIEMKLDAACLSAIGNPDPVSACVGMVADAMQASQGSTPQCTFAAGVCTCTESVPYDDTRTYTTTGSTLLADGYPQGPYCVQGDKAVLFVTLTDGCRRTDLERGLPSTPDAGMPDAGPKSPSVEGTELMQTGDSLLDVYVAPAGIYVVTVAGVTLLDRKGKQLARVTASTALTAAAFDGSLLVVTDATTLKSYDTSLKQVASAALSASCASAVLMAGSRVVCGTANDARRVFYTYDARTGKLLQTSPPYAYLGLSMRRVPGTSELVTVTAGSPAALELFDSGTLGRVVHLGESQLWTDVRITNVYAWDALPATHLILSDGTVVGVSADECQPDADGGTANSSCLARDGTLGPLAPIPRGPGLGLPAAFAAMDTDAHGKLHVVLGGAGRAGDCDEGFVNCKLQRIDVATHAVEAEKTTYFSSGRFVALRYDATTSKVVIGYELVDHYSGAVMPATYRIATFAEE